MRKKFVNRNKKTELFLSNSSVFFRFYSMQGVVIVYAMA